MDGEPFESYRDLLQHLEEMRAAAAADDSLDNRLNLATTLLEVAQEELFAEEWNEAITLIDEAMPLARELAEQLPGDRIATGTLAIALFLAASCAIREDRAEDARPLIEEATGLQQTLLEGARNEEAILLAAMGASVTAEYLEAMEDDAEALRSWEQAVAWRREAIRVLGVSESTLTALANALESWADRAASLGRNRTAVTAFREAIKVRRTILAEHSNEASHFDMLAQVLGDLADLLTSVDQAAATMCCRDALEAVEKGLEQEDESSEDALLQTKAETLEILYNVLDDDEEAFLALSTAADIYRELLRGYPDSGEILDGLRGTLSTLREFHKETGNLTAAREVARELRRLDG